MNEYADALSWSGHRSLGAADQKNLPHREQAARANPSSPNMATL